MERTPLQPRSRRRGPLRRRSLRQRQFLFPARSEPAHRPHLHRAPGGEARFAEGLYVSGNFFSLLGVNPLIGHTFTAQDDTAACPDPGAVLSYGFWQREFDGDPAALGRTVSLDGHPIPI